MAVAGNLRGSQGIQGIQGNAGPGLPAGGSAAQIAEKIDGTDYNTQWANKSWIVKGKAANQTVTNSAVLVDDDTVSFPVVANGKYRLRMYVIFDTTAAGDFKFSITGPVASLYRVFRRSLVASNGALTQAMEFAYPANISLVGTGTQGGFIILDGVIHIGNAGGTVQFRFSQNTQTNDSGAVVLAGSFVEYQIV